MYDITIIPKAVYFDFPVTFLYKNSVKEDVIEREQDLPGYDFIDFMKEKEGRVFVAPEEQDLPDILEVMGHPVDKWIKTLQETAWRTEIPDRLKPADKFRSLYLGTYAELYPSGTENSDRVFPDCGLCNGTGTVPHQIDYSFLRNDIEKVITGIDRKRCADESQGPVSEKYTEELRYDLVEFKDSLRCTQQCPVCAGQKSIELIIDHLFWLELLDRFPEGLDILPGSYIGNPTEDVFLMQIKGEDNGGSREAGTEFQTGF